MRSRGDFTRVEEESTIFTGSLTESLLAWESITIDSGVYPILVADAVGSGVQFTESQTTVALRDPCEYRLGPRKIVTPENGFTTVIPAGRVVVINGISYVVERGR